MPNSRRNEKLDVDEEYTPERYPFYDNYPKAINVDKTRDIPDYDGEMGVPISFLSRHNPDQFEIVAMGNSWDVGVLSANGKHRCARIVIKRKKS